MLKADITGLIIYEAFVSGKNKVVIFKEELNRINVFPVNDSDTGNNLSNTLNSIIETVDPVESPDEMVKLFADASLNGARGNSGIIFAQFINGLASEISSKSFERTIFTDLIKKAVPYAYSAISKPTEGTILTVIKDWADALEKFSKEDNNFEELFNKSLEAAELSLQNTPEQLKVLKDANVVDAGAQGFVHFLEGISDYIAGIKTNKEEKNSADFIHKHDVFIQEEIKFRYCCEALLIGKDIDTEEIKRRMEPLGDSLIVAGTSEKVKVHIHSNTPMEIFLELRKFARISQQKIDDMKMEQEINSKRKHSIALVTDSIADLPKKYIEENQIHVVPLNIDIDGSVFLDKMGLNNEVLFSITDDLKTFPTSSQPSIKFVKQKLDYLKDKYESIIIISVSAEMSGTWNVFKTVAEDLRKEGIKVSLIDSCLNSGAQGLLVMEAAEMIKNKYSHDEIVEFIEKQKKKTKIYVSVSDFNFMVRGGRVSPLKGKMAKLLNLKPIIGLDENGKGYSFANAFSQKGNLKKIADIVLNIQKNGKMKKYGIVHGHDLEKGEEYNKFFTELIGQKPEFIEEISSVVALNAGRGAVALCIMKE